MSTTGSRHATRRCAARLGCAALSLGLAACPDPITDTPDVAPDATVLDAAPRDASAADAGAADASVSPADGGFRVEAVNLAPGAGAGSSGMYRLHIGLRPGGDRASSEQFRLKASLVPISPARE